MNEITTTLLVAALWIVLAVPLLASRDAIERKYLWASLFAHQASAIAMVMVTNYYYGGGDMTNYFWIGKFIAGHLRNDFFDLAPALVNVILQREQMLPFPGTMTTSNTGSIQALSGFLVYFFQDSLYAVCMAIAGASFAAKVALFDVFKHQLPDVPRGQLCFACLLLPSTVFWSSGLLKEPIAVIGMSAMISGGHLMAYRKQLSKGGVRMLLGAGVAGLFKGYVVPVFGIAAGLWLLARTVQRRLGQVVIRTRYVVGAAVLILATFVLTGMALPQFAPDVFADEARNAQETGAHVEGGSNYELGASGSMGAQLPLAIATVLFRPVLFEANTTFVFLNALEMLWFTVAFAIVLFRRPLVTNLRLILSSPALAFCLGFVITLSVGVGLTTTNLGTLSRYRMPLMPFYAILLVVLRAKITGQQLAAPAVVAMPTLNRPQPLQT
jgi:hypothetical protein